MFERAEKLCGESDGPKQTETKSVGSLKSNNVPNEFGGAYFPGEDRAPIGRRF